MRRNQFITATAMAGLLLGGFAVAGRAQEDSDVSLDFTRAPVTDVVSQFHTRYGASIVLKRGVSPYQTVTFWVDGVNMPGGRLDFVNNLANALGADFSKDFVVSRLSDDSSAPDPIINSSNAPVVFPSTTLPAEDAIRTVAGVDGASVQFYAPIDGDVTLSSRHLTAAEASRQIAEQTHTLWKAFYAITPNEMGRPSGSVVIGRTRDGDSITETPLISYRAPIEPPAPKPGQTATVTVPSPQEQQYPYGYNPYGVAYNSGNSYGIDNPLATTNNPYGYSSGQTGSSYMGPVSVGAGLSVMGGDIYGPPIQLP